MSYVERIFIGLILLISAYSFYNNSQERHQFHQAVALRKHSSYLVSKTVGKCLGCFPCIEKYRSAFVVLLLTGGVSLVFDFGVTVAILSQLLILAIDASTLRCEFDSDSYRSVLINFVILLILLKNSSCFSCKSKKISNISA
jgi:hypothetical protein